MADQTTLEQRIARLEAIEEIKALKYRYWRACDGKDPEGFRAAFIAKGAFIDFGPLGSFDDADGIAEVYSAIAPQKDQDRHLTLDLHHGVHPDIRITGDAGATGKRQLRLSVMMPPSSGPDTVATAMTAPMYPAYRPRSRGETIEPITDCTRAINPPMATP